MKKRPFLLFLLVLSLLVTSCIVVQAQKRTATPETRETSNTLHPPKTFTRWSVDLLAGPAFPVGKYANMEHGVPGGGPVHMGGAAELSGTYHLNRSFGVVLLAGGQLNKGNGIPYTQPMHPLPPGTLPGAYFLGPPSNGEYWAIARFMAGGEYTIPIHRKRGLSLLIRALAGTQTTKPADYNYYFPDNGGRISYHYIGLPWSFSYQADAGFKWQPLGRVALMAYAGYNGAQPSKSFTYLVGDLTTVYSYYTIHAKIPTGSLLFRAGIDIGL